MEREEWVRGGMVLSILALVAAVSITPVFLGRPPSVLGATPLLTVAMSRNESWFLVDLSAAVQRYRYEIIRLTINGTNPSANWTFRMAAEEREVYDLYRWVPGNATFSMNVYFVDQQVKPNYFEYNVTARATHDVDNRTVMIFTFPFEMDRKGIVERRFPPQDYRLGIPWRGTLP